MHMADRSEQAVREIEREHFAATGSDDFDVPQVHRKVREQAGLRQGSPEALMGAVERALDAEGITGEEREQALARARAAVAE